MKYVATVLSVLVVCALATAPAHAHFKLLAPQSWIVENDLGDPQKAGPCGGTQANQGTPTQAVNKVTGGQKLHIKIQETVYHPGHYRIALAANRSELPPDPQVTTRESARGPQSVSAVIEKDLKPPLIVDGLFAHTSRQADPWETDIEIPNINCTKCTLQIIQFMAEHGLNREGDFSYHHCADLQITADPAKPIDKRWSSAK